MISNGRRREQKTRRPARTASGFLGPVLFILSCTSPQDANPGLGDTDDLGVPTGDLAGSPGKFQIHHINVGQGDAALLVAPNGQTALFDSGNVYDCSGIKRYLRDRGLTRIDYHFLSHYHSDHMGCLEQLAEVGIQIITAGYDRGDASPSPVFTGYANTLGALRKTVAKGQTILLDAAAPTPVRVTCVDLNGAGVYPPAGGDENAMSVVFKVSYGAFDEVIGGDLTGSTARMDDVESTVAAAVGPVEVYKVHHHGSAFSSNDNWLNQTSPLVGIISVGNGNTYGHPASASLRRLHDHGVKTYWTERGAGAQPDPAWDQVGGNIVIEATPEPGARFTVSGSGLSDSYVSR
jgi:beta-lactamase superfamily II metal-dependent hydrolase